MYEVCTAMVSYLPSLRPGKGKLGGRLETHGLLATYLVTYVGKYLKPAFPS